VPHAFPGYIFKQFYSNIVLLYSLAIWSPISDGYSSCPKFISVEVMMKRLLFLLVLGSLMACQGSSPIDQSTNAVEGVAFIRAALDQAMTRAKSENKLVLVDVYSDT
jgi:thiol:disulfide interchange protein